MDRDHRAVLLVCLGAGFTTLLDQSVLNIVVPALRDSLHAGPAAVQWIVAGYSLSFGLALVPAGRVGDIAGRRRLFAGGLALFALGAVVAGTAGNAWVVAAARLVQGLGAGTVNPQIIGLFQDTFAGRDRTRALAAYAAVGGLAAALGPPVGGLVLQLTGPDLGWRLVLLLNLPFALVMVPLAARRLPSTRHPGRRPDLDLAGLLLLGAALVGVVLPLTGTAGGWRWAAAAGAFVAVFVLWERRYTARGRTAVLMPALTRSPGYVLGTLVAMCYFGATLALTLALTLFLQNGLGYTPLATAALTLPGAIGFALASSASTAMVTRFGRPGVSVALGVAAAGIAAEAAAVWLLPVGAVVAALAAAQFVTGAAGGLINAPNQALTLGHAPPGAHGLSAGVLQLSQRLAAALSVAAVSGVALTAPPGLAGQRTALLHGTLICLALVVLAAIFAFADGAIVRGCTSDSTCRPIPPTRAGSPQSSAASGFAGTAASAPRSPESAS
ncbi:MFS transporter [Dactylosporangium sp. CA-233914]|uniref:MFS transporter n=1 Tax=Dactylosporangium sp. CA-233914 TaxID=3239934 RepID=UPI003D8B9173